MDMNDELEALRREIFNNTGQRLSNDDPICHAFVLLRRFQLEFYKEFKSEFSASALTSASRQALEEYRLTLPQLTDGCLIRLVESGNLIVEKQSDRLADQATNVAGVFVAETKKYCSEVSKAALEAALNDAEDQISAWSKSLQARSDALIEQIDALTPSKILFFTAITSLLSGLISALIIFKYLH